MKKTVSVLVVLTVLTVFSSVVMADCESECNGPFQTCLDICRQTEKEDSAGANKCVNSCLKGVSGCQKRCEAKNKKSENIENGKEGCLLAAVNFAVRDNNIVLGASCIEQGLQCTLNGTPCCAPYTCKGKFPITTCQ